jgi:hypothetical protein
VHLVHYRALLPNSRFWVRAKSLAVQTTKATENVAGQIAAVQESTTTAVAAIGRITERNAGDQRGHLVGCRFCASAGRL